MSIAYLSLILITFGIFGALNAEQNYIVLKLEGSDGVVSESIPLLPGDVAETVKSHNFSFDSLSYKVTYGKNEIYRPHGETVYGPSKLQVVGNKEEGEGLGYIVVRVVRPSKEVKSILGTIQLSESKEQSTEIFLEESVDLIHWKRSKPGVYRGSNPTKYYRANRALVKELGNFR